MGRFNFVLDIGNTTVNAGLFQGEKLEVVRKVFLKELGYLIDRCLSQYEIKNLIVSSVSLTQSEIQHLIADRIEWIWFDGRCSLPISIAYKSISTLGSDRLAGIMGVYNQYPGKNVLVIDAGTCITYDILTHENLYLGGSISPGMEMRFKSLQAFTAKLPLCNYIQKPELIGRTTQEAILSGVYKGIVNEIDGCISEYDLAFGNLVVICTGGDAINFVDELKNTIFVDLNLILNGLNKTLDNYY